MTSFAFVQVTSCAFEGRTFLNFDQRGLILGAISVLCSTESCMQGCAEQLRKQKMPPTPSKWAYGTALKIDQEFT